MREEDYREWQNDGQHYEKAKTENDLHNEISSLKSQLADIKYLSEYEIDKAIFGQMDYDENGKMIDFDANKAVTAICKLAIPDIDNEVGEPVTGKPALYPIETKDIYYSDVKLCGTGGSGCDTFVEQIAKREIKELKEELQQERTTREELQLQFEKVQRKLDKELNMNFEKSDNQILKLMTKNKALKSQLASVKYLNAGEVEKIFNDCLPEDFNFAEEKILTMTDQENIIQAICKLAIDIDRDKIIKVLDRFLFTDTDNPLEIVSGTATVLTSTGTIADEIIKVLEGK